MSCDLQKSRKEFIEKDIPLKQFSNDDELFSVDFIDYDDILQNGQETTDQSLNLENMNDYSIDTHENTVFIYTPQLKKPQNKVVQRNIAQEQYETSFVHTFPKTHSKSFKPQKLSFEKEGLLLLNKKYVYCKVEEKQLNVYSSKESKQLILSIRFDIFQASVKIIYNQKGQALCLIIKLLTEVPLEYRLYHSDQEELQNWFKDINYQILASQHLLKPIPRFNFLKNYQKKVHITEQDFLRQADSLDLVFFLGKSIGQHVTRLVSMSDYDHIALVLRGQNDKIFFFESGQTHGVTLYTYDKFKNHNWKDYYKQVVYRKLHCNRTNEMIENLEKFVKSAAGKGYELSLSKLFKKKSIINQAEAEEGRTYFCSELIAAAYKRMGLISSEVSSAQYWPGNFSEQGNIKLLLENSYLSSEKVIYI